MERVERLSQLECSTACGTLDLEGPLVSKGWNPLNSLRTVKPSASDKQSTAKSSRPDQKLPRQDREAEGPQVRNDLRTVRRRPRESNLMPLLRPGVGVFKKDR